MSHATTSRRLLWLGLTLFVGMAGISGHVLSLSIYESITFHFGAAGGWSHFVLSVLLFAISFWLANYLRSPRETRTHQSLLGFILRKRSTWYRGSLVLAVFFVHGVGLKAHTVVSPHTGPPQAPGPWHGLLIVGMLVAFVLSLLLADHIGEKLFTPADRLQPGTEDQPSRPTKPKLTKELDRSRIRALAVLVSTSNKKDPKFTMPASEGEPLRVDFADNTYVTLQGRPDSLDADIAAIDQVKYWNWQQTLRSFRYHLGPQSQVRRVYLIGSSDSKDTNGKEFLGSTRHLEDIISLLRRYASTGVDFIPVKDVPFNDFEKCATAIREQVIEDAKKSGIPHRGLIVDTTGGTKIASLAAMSCILTNDALMQYVETGSEGRGDCDSLVFDPWMFMPIHV